MMKIFLMIMFLSFFSTAFAQTGKLVPPEHGVYHGASPGMGPTEDVVTTERIEEFEYLSGKPVAWVYFSDNWFDGIKFPMEKAEEIQKAGSIPFIRMMPRSDFISYAPDPAYTMQDIIEGKYDEELTQYAKDAVSYGAPLIIEFGTEVNGNWFSWNGEYNGGGETSGYGDTLYPDGPERFRDAYRHIIDIFRNEGADNITWAYHVNSGSAPKENWNNMASYYPGDDYIDWIGVSIYGAQVPGTKWVSFTALMDIAYKEMSQVSEDKPLAVFEFGVIEDPANGNKDEWISEALESVSSGRYPRIKAISYWHAAWENGSGGISNMRIDTSNESLNAYRRGISSDYFIPEAKFK